MLIVLVTSSNGLQSQSVGHRGAAKVELVKNNNRWQLLRNGKPHYIHGAGGAGVDGPMDMLVDYGANSTRNWGADPKSVAALDKALKHGISVAQGLWLEHQDHKGKEYPQGFDYNNLDHVMAQTRKVMSDVMRLKDHPSILVWGVGNEMEGTEGNDPAIWLHIEDLASRIKAVDPNHPIMTVIAEIGGRKLEAIEELCPSVDLIGINSYGGGPSLPQRYRESGCKKPYIVTEFGPLGTWEVGKNEFNAVVEPTSTAKVDQYRASYEAFKADENCLGAYAFLWGWKQEGTATWFGMLTKDNRKTAAVDLMTNYWTGKPAKNLCPKIDDFKIDGSNQGKPNEIVKFALSASDPENKPLTVKWVVTDEVEYVTGGFKQKEANVLNKCIVKSDDKGAQIKLPNVDGIIRVYAYVEDGDGSIATANLPVLVKSK